MRQGGQVSKNQLPGLSGRAPHFSDSSTEPERQKEARSTRRPVCCSTEPGGTAKLSCSSGLIVEINNKGGQILCSMCNGDFMHVLQTRCSTSLPNLFLPPYSGIGLFKSLWEEAGPSVA